MFINFIPGCSRAELALNLRYSYLRYLPNLPGNTPYMSTSSYAHSLILYHLLLQTIQVLVPQIMPT